MTPRRLLHQGGDGFEQELLRAACSDRPSRQSRSKLLVSLGVAVATTTSAEGAGAAGALSTAAKAWVVKALAVVALAGTSIATVHATRSTANREPVALAARRVELPRTKPTPEPVALPAVPVPAVPISPAVVVPTRHGHAEAAASRELVPVQAPARAESLAQETAALDAARSTLRAGHASEAIVLLDAYARRFPNGTLGPEASALRVEALLAAGDREGAGAAARALTAEQPVSPAALRARALLNR
jgi:hypothetical protein